MNQNIRCLINTSRKIGLLTLGVFSVNQCINAQGKTAKPNIIFILVDDLRWDNMGFIGKYPYLKTPNIDRIRNEGVHFANAFCTHSLSAPSRATMLTGMFPQTNGVSTNQEGRELDLDKTPSFAGILRTNGYSTGFVGKWHMANHNRPRKGFDYWCSFTGQGNYNGNILNINGEEVRNEGYITDELNNYALEFIRANAGKPFCLYLSHKAVHQPFTPAERHAGLYDDATVPEPESWKDDMDDKPDWQKINPNMAQRQRLREKDLQKIVPQKIRKSGPWPGRGIGEQKNYQRSLSSVDEGIGKIYELLEEEGILGNTIIMFAGDNGFFHGEHGKGDKRLAYNEAIRIPLVMRYPGAAKPGTTIEEMVLNADIAPTFLDIAGMEIPESMQGKSIVPLLKGKTEGWRKSFLYTYWSDLIHFIPRIVAIRTERYLYSTTPDLDDIDELYNVVEDPFEMINLALDPNYDDIRNRLAKEMELLKAETGYLDDVPRPDPEPDPGKTGKLLSLDFGTGIPSSQAVLKGITNVTVNSETFGAFTPNSSALVEYDPELEPSSGRFIVDCRVKSDSSDGVIASSGFYGNGWALFLEDGKPGFVVAHNQHLQFVDSDIDVTGKLCSITAVIENYRNELRLYVDGRLVDRRMMLLPIQALNNKMDRSISIGADTGEPVDELVISQYRLTGLIDHVTFYREKSSLPGTIEQELLKATKN